MIFYPDSHFVGKNQSCIPDKLKIWPTLNCISTLIRIFTEKAKHHVSRNCENNVDNGQSHHDFARPLRVLQMIYTAYVCEHTHVICSANFRCSILILGIPCNRTPPSQYCTHWWTYGHTVVYLQKCVCV